MCARFAGPRYALARACSDLDPARTSPDATCHFIERSPARVRRRQQRRETPSANDRWCARGERLVSAAASATTGGNGRPRHTRRRRIRSRAPAIAAAREGAERRRFRRRGHRRRVAAEESTWRTVEAPRRAPPPPRRRISPRPDDLAPRRRIFAARLVTRVLWGRGGGAATVGLSCIAVRHAASFTRSRVDGCS